MLSPRARRTLVAAGIALALLIPATLSPFDQDQAALAAITAVLVVSVVVLSGYVGQISFCQFSFAAIGAFTTGALVDGHGWSFWLAMPVGVVAAALVGVLVGIPALRLTGLLLAVLTVAVALFFDRFLLATDTWPAFSGGSVQWHPHKPSFLGMSLQREYAFYAFTFGVFLLVVWLVWNLRKGKVGRMLRAVRDSELAAATMGVNVTAWKLAAFGLSAGIAGLAGCLLAVANESVSAGSYDFIHSVQLLAIATVWGVGVLAAAALGGAFYVYGPELLAKTPLSAKWFSLILGGVLVAQLVFSPDGIIPKAMSDIEHALRRGRGTRPPESRSETPAVEVA
jgi:branched-chain amino acid transport system permease protein